MNVSVKEHKDELTRFLCPVCDGPCRIIDSRITLSAGYKQRRRRYKCLDCDTRFTTLEWIMSGSIKTKNN